MTFTRWLAVLMTTAFAGNAVPVAAQSARRPSTPSRATAAPASSILADESKEDAIDRIDRWAYEDTMALRTLRPSLKSRDNLSMAWRRNGQLLWLKFWSGGENGSWTIGHLRDGRLYLITTVSTSQLPSSHYYLANGRLVHAVAYGTDPEGRTPSADALAEDFPMDLAVLQRAAKALKLSPLRY